MLFTGDFVLHYYVEFSQIRSHVSLCTHVHTYRHVSITYCITFMCILFYQDDPSVLDIAISNLPNNIEVTFDSTNRPSSLSGLDEVDSGLDDIDLSSSHYSWAHFDTETIKRKVRSNIRDG